jgi:hypothetical protein
MTFEVIVEHVSLEPGNVGGDRVEVHRFKYREARSAAMVLNAYLEAGPELLCIPLRRHGRFYILDSATGLKEWPLVPFCREHKLAEFLKPEEV